MNKIKIWIKQLLCQHEYSSLEGERGASIISAEGKGKWCKCSKCKKYKEIKIEEYDF